MLAVISFVCLRVLGGQAVQKRPEELGVEEARRWIIFIPPLCQQWKLRLTNSHACSATIKTKRRLPGRIASHFDSRTNHHGVSLDCYP